jgi:hypothetical protein
MSRSRCRCLIRGLLWIGRVRIDWIGKGGGLRGRGVGSGGGVCRSMLRWWGGLLERCKSTKQEKKATPNYACWGKPGAAKCKASRSGAAWSRSLLWKDSVSIRKLLRFCLNTYRRAGKSTRRNCRFQRYQTSLGNFVCLCPESGRKNVRPERSGVSLLMTILILGHNSRTAWNSMISNSPKPPNPHQSNPQQNLSPPSQTS